MSLIEILGTDLVKDSRADINANFNYLQSLIDAVEADPAGTTGQIQFNDDGAFGGARLVYSEAGANSKLQHTGDGVFTLSIKEDVGSINIEEGYTEIKNSGLGLEATGPSGTTALYLTQTEATLDIEQIFTFRTGGANRNLLLFSDFVDGRYEFGNFAGRRGFLNFSNIATSNKTFTFPNATGTVGTVITKDTTGDPSETIEGLFCTNTFDNNFKVYADGGWRTITTW